MRGVPSPGALLLTAVVVLAGCTAPEAASAAVDPAPTTTTTEPAVSPSMTTPIGTTTTTLPPRVGIAPNLAYPTIEPEVPFEPFTPASPAGLRIEPAPGTVALTFDDGPDPKYTPVILDILRDHGAVATFFVLGWKVDAYPDIARRIVEDGHSLQNHAYRHHNLTNRSDAAVAGLISDTARAIHEATGVTPTCLRPPQGITNSRLAQTAAANGHVILLWDSRGNSLDYSLGTASGVLGRARNWQAGDITLMHDTWGFLYRAALPQILEDLEERGIGTSTLCVRTEPMPVPQVL